MAFEKSRWRGPAVAHFTALGNQHMRVPLWDDNEEECILFYNPLNVEDRIKLDEDHPDYLIEVIIRHTMDEHGKPAFTLADKVWMRTHASPFVISIIANTILNADSIDPKLLGESLSPDAKTENSSESSTT